MLRTPVDCRSPLRSFVYFVRTHLLRQRLLLARVEPTGLSVRAYSRDLVGRHLYKRGTYESELTQFVLCDLDLPADGVILDVGANLGWYSLLLGKRYPEARIHAFEPEPRNLALLRENVERNGLGNVDVHAMAVAESPGTMKLYPYAEKNMGRHSLLPINNEDAVEVRTVSLDAFLDEHGIAPEEVSFVKVDIEGYETPALRGATRLLAAGPVILSEFAPKYMRRGGLDPADYLELLRDAGYRAYRYDPSASTLELCPQDALDGEQRLDLVWKKTP